MQQVSSMVSVCPMPLRCSPKWKLSVTPSCSPHLQIGCPDLPLPGGGYRNGDVGVFIDSRAASPLCPKGSLGIGGHMAPARPCHAALVCVSIHPTGNGELELSPWALGRGARCCPGQSRTRVPPPPCTRALLHILCRNGDGRCRIKSWGHHLFIGDYIKERLI